MFESPQVSWAIFSTSSLSSGTIHFSRKPQFLLLENGTVLETTPRLSMNLTGGVGSLT